jgi:hypothetical protein
MHAERPIPSQDKTRELQRELYLAAKRSRNRRFHALYDRIFRPDVLWRAWEEVRRNGGSAGIDGVTIVDVERVGAVLPEWKMRKFLKTARRRLSESRMGENLMSGSMWQGMETRQGDGIEALSQEAERQRSI